MLYCCLCALSYQRQRHHRSNTDFRLIGNPNNVIVQHIATSVCAYASLSLSLSESAPLCEWESIRFYILSPCPSTAHFFAVSICPWRARLLYVERMSACCTWSKQTRRNAKGQIGVLQRIRWAGGEFLTTRYVSIRLGCCADVSSVPIPFVLSMVRGSPLPSRSIFLKSRPHTLFHV